MATENGMSCEHITNFFLNLMCMRFLADTNAAEVKLIRSSFYIIICGAPDTEVIGNVAEKRNQLLCSSLETTFCAFFDIKRGYKIKI